ncbi:MAG: Txe/YoeB family addiction module toxin [Bacteroidales bacterium]|nr:Txe/YoeB family addiction module toxin [Bacteroidales bacterium]
MKIISFEQSALQDYITWSSLDKNIFKKINKLIKDILRSPFEGEGKPEALKYEMSGYWSRRISDSDRLVYKVENETVLIIQCKGHYSDK